MQAKSALAMLVLVKSKPAAAAARASIGILPHGLVACNAGLVPHRELARCKHRKIRPKRAACPEIEQVPASRTVVLHPIAPPERRFSYAPQLKIAT